MNTYIRNQLTKTIRKAVSAIRQEGYELTKVLENIIDIEEEKRSNMPESFANGTRAMNLEEAIENLSSALDTLTSGLEEIDEVATILDICVNYTPSERKQEEKLSEGTKGIRFQALLPNVMMEELRKISSYTGASKNEILCRALKQYLSDKRKFIPL